MAPYTIRELENIVAPIAKRHGVESVRLFGSYARGTANEASDVDLLIEKGRLNSLFQLSAFRLDIEDALRLPVDLVTTASTDKLFIDAISREEVLLYRDA